MILKYILNQVMNIFNIEKYLYKNICYVNYPEETIKNETNKRCLCKYKIYYNEKNNYYECFKENETCKEKIYIN